MKNTDFSEFKIAVIQHPPVFLNLAASIEKACRLIEEAAGNDAEVIVFPETWLPGYPVWLDYAPKAALWNHPPAKALFRVLADNSLVIPGNEFQELLAAAGKTGIYIVMGAHERDGGTLYNTMVYLDKNGKDYEIHRKLVPTYTERLLWGRGDGSTLSVLETSHGILGGLICWEHWMPLARAAMHAKQELLHVAQWPAVKELHQIASRQYAFEGQCYVAAAGSILTRQDIIDGFNSIPNPPAEALELLESMPGKSSEYFLNGGSAIIAPTAEYICEPIFDNAAIIYTDIDPQITTEGHLFIDTDGHYSRPDIFSLNVNTTPQTCVNFESDDD